VGLTLAPLAHRGPERLARGGGRGFDLSQPDVRLVHELLLLYQVLRRLTHRLRFEPDFHRKDRTAIEVRADVFGKVIPAQGTRVRPAPEGISAEFHHAQAEATGQALDDHVIRAIDEEQVAFVRSQCSGPCAIEVRQPAAIHMLSTSPQLSTQPELHAVMRSRSYGRQKRRSNRPPRALTAQFSHSIGSGRIEAHA